MYNEELEYLIDAALADGILTEKEKQILFKRAQAMGIDLDEFEMVLDARLVKMKLTEEQEKQEVHHVTRENGVGLRSMVGKIRKVRERALDVTKKSAEETSGWIAKTAKDAGEWAAKTAKDASAWTVQACKDAAGRTSKAYKEAYKRTSQAFLDATDWSKQAVVDIKDNAVLLATDNETPKRALRATLDAAKKTGKITVKGLKVVSGVQAVQSRKKSITNKKEADLLKSEIESTTEAIRDDLNETLEVFGKRRLRALKLTVGTFLDYLERMNQRSKIKEYNFLKEIDMKPDELAEMKQVDMKASDAAKVFAVGGGFAAIGLAGTPALVTGIVTSFAAASTGTAISSLSGAAASNAVLAWLGGGAVAAGGGGMAAGAAVMTAITATTTAGLALVAVGTLASAFYSRKNTESEQYLAEIKTWASETEQSWVVMNAIKERVLELQTLTEELEKRAMLLLGRMEPFVDCFDPQIQEMLETFQQAAIAVKSMSELAQTPILDEDGNISQVANIVIAKTEKVLNNQL